jgi:hypothetical protein
VCLVWGVDSIHMRIFGKIWDKTVQLKTSRPSHSTIVGDSHERHMRQSLLLSTHPWLNLSPKKFSTMTWETRRWVRPDFGRDSTIQSRCRIGVILTGVLVQRLPPHPLIGVLIVIHSIVHLFFISTSNQSANPLFYLSRAWLIFLSYLTATCLKCIEYFWTC